LTVKDYKVEELYKKCGFKKSEGFTLQVEWPVKLEGQRYLIQMYGKLDGKANMENKYDFPPPVDKNLYFGSCALVGMLRDDSNNRAHINLSVELWNKIFEKLGVVGKAPRGVAPNSPKFRQKPTRIWWVFCFPSLFVGFPSTC
jgi:hypothetical protein